MRIAITEIGSSPKISGQVSYQVKSSDQEF